MNNNITILGEALIDFIGIENGTLKEITKFEKKIGGAPLNVAYTLSQMSKTPIFIGSVGNDSFGKTIIDNLSNYIDVKNIKVSQFPTTLAFVSLDNQGERSFEFFRGADVDYQYKDIPKIAFESFFFHFCSATAFLKGDLYETYMKLLEYAKKNDKFISFDPNYREALFPDQKEAFIQKSKLFLQNSHLIKLSEEELFLITESNHLEESKRRIINLSKKNSYIVITRGAKGSILLQNENEKFIDSIKIKMIDSTGAGDAFIGSLVSQITEKHNSLTFKRMIEFIKISSIIGANVASQKGAQTIIPTKEEIKKKLNF